MHEIGAIDSLVPRLARTLARGGRAFLSIRIAEFTDGRVTPHGLIAPADVQYLRTVLAARLVAGARASGAEVTGIATMTMPAEAPGEAPNEQEFEFLRGVNLFLDRR